MYTEDPKKSVDIIRIQDIIFIYADFKNHTFCYRAFLTFSSFEGIQDPIKLFFCSKIHAVDTEEPRKSVDIIRIPDVIFIYADFKNQTFCYRVNLTFSSFEGILDPIKLFFWY